MENTSGEFSVVHYFDAEKNDLMFVRFWVNGHEVLCNPVRDCGA